jgi:hypothetical protein
MTLDVKTLEKILESRDNRIDLYETLIIGLGSKSPDAVLSNILGVESVAGLTVMFGAIGSSGRICLTVYRGETVIKDSVTAAYAPDAEEGERVNSHLFDRLHELEGMLERSRNKVASLEQLLLKTCTGEPNKEDK